MSASTSSSRPAARQRQLLRHLSATPAPAAASKEWWTTPPGAATNVLQQFDMTASSQAGRPFACDLSVYFEHISWVFQGKVALITGGTGWLGTAFAESLAEVGATVIVSSTALQRGQDAAAALPTPAGQTHHGVEMDHMDEGSILAGFAAAVATAGQVDVLINNGLGYDLTFDRPLWLVSVHFLAVNVADGYFYRPILDGFVCLSDGKCRK